LARSKNNNFKFLNFLIYFTYIFGSNLSLLYFIGQRVLWYRHITVSIFHPLHKDWKKENRKKLHSTWCRNLSVRYFLSLGNYEFSATEISRNSNIRLEKVCRTYM